MTNDYDKLHAMDACATLLHWVDDRTIEQVWRDCERSDWMCWLLESIAPNDRRCRLAAATFAERVWHMIPDEQTRLTAAWAIGAARHGDEDEMRAASMAAATPAHAASVVDTYAIYAAAYAANNTAAAVGNAAAYAAYAVYDDYNDNAYATERAAQADILREYFSAREIGKLFRQAPA